MHNVIQLCIIVHHLFNSLTSDWLVLFRSVITPQKYYFKCPVFLRFSNDSFLADLYCIAFASKRQKCPMGKNVVTAKETVITYSKFFLLVTRIEDHQFVSCFENSDIIILFYFCLFIYLF